MRDASEMGQRLALRSIYPDRIISSPATRAMQTAELIAREIGYPIEQITQRTNVYEAHFTDLLAIIHRVDARFKHVMLIGHNPALTDLCDHLAENSIESLLPCGIFCLEFDVQSWSEIARETGVVVFHDQP